VNFTLRILGIPVLSLTTDDDAGSDLGPGVSADVTLAPGFVPDRPWWDDE
jgi:hypothetical protein